MFPGNDNNPPAKLYTRYPRTKSLLNPPLPLRLFARFFKINIIFLLKCNSFPPGQRWAILDRERLESSRLLDLNLPRGVRMFQNREKRRLKAQKSAGRRKSSFQAVTNKSDLLRHDPINAKYRDLSRYLYRTGGKDVEMFCLRPPWAIH